MKINASTSTDGYKLGHGSMYPYRTDKVYSNLTPRSDKHYLKDATSFYDGRLVWVGALGSLKEICDYWEVFFSSPEDVAINRYAKRLMGYLGGFDPAVEKMASLHRLGYLPLEVKSLKEGTKVPMGVPTLTITNTLDEFYWLVNYLEPSLSANSWKTPTAATRAAEYRAICDHFAKLTCDDNSHVDFQCHDFSMRGMSGVEDAARTGVAHLTQFLGTDSLGAMDYAENYYNVEDSLIAVSIPATEHAVATSNIIYNQNKFPISKLEAEKMFLIDLITERFPTGMISYVADSFDFWGVMTKVLPEVKEEILSRQDSDATPAKLVIRPDSGDPVKVISGYKNSELTLNKEGLLECRETGKVISIDESFGAVEVLYNIFGGHVNSKGYKVLNSKIGLIYGDSITPERAEAILLRLKKKGFCSSCVVFGIGSMSYQYFTRDTFGFAVKATHIGVEGEGGISIYKDPKGDSGKSSAKGLLFVTEDMELIEDCTPEMEASDNNQLKTIFKDGMFINETSLDEIRLRLKEGN